MAPSLPTRRRQPLRGTKKATVTSSNTPARKRKIQFEVVIPIRPKKRLRETVLDDVKNDVKKHLEEVSTIQVNTEGQGQVDGKHEVDMVAVVQNVKLKSESREDDSVLKFSLHCETAPTVILTSDPKILKKIEEVDSNIPPVPAPPTPTQQTPDCSCGTCVDGWLSPRMRFRLQRITAKLMRHMDETVDPQNILFSTVRKEQVFTQFQPLPRDSPLFTTDIPLSFIPPHLRDTVFKTFYRGYHAIFIAISFVVNTSPIGPGWFPSCIPSIRAIHCHIPRLHYYLTGPVNHFLSKGGSVAFAVDCLTRRAMVTAMAPFGDGSFDTQYGTSESDLKHEDGGKPSATGEGGSIRRAEADDWKRRILEGYRKTWSELPTCNNDLKFDLLREKVGLRADTIWGPYTDNTPANNFYY